jgi:peptidoglycan-associated lipoprotein
MGGLDNFKSTRQGDSDSWGEVENMQYPMNSSSNDFGIVFEGSDEKGFFSSDRSGGRGGDDIWSFRIPPLKFVIDGMVSDVETGEPVPNATIEMKGTDGSTVQVTTDELGYYQFDKKEGSDERYVKNNTSYTLVVQADGYLNGKGQETTVGVNQSTRFKHDFKLQSIQQDEIEFPEVRYDLGEWELQVTDSVNSKDSLDYLYQVLVDNPNIVVELMAHTDTRGSAASNQTLSQKRAQSCVDYLISKGIAAERMEAKGYGENEPRISDAEIADLPTKEEKEAAHQKNRRTTFRVIRDDYVPKDNGDSGDEEPQMNNEGEQPMEGEGSETDSE